MGLQEVMEETRRQLEEAQKAEAAVVEDEVVEKVEEAPKPVEEPVKEEPKPEPEAPKAEEKTPSDYARERREAKMAKTALADQLAAANARIAEFERQSTKAPEPNKDEDPVAYLQNKLEKQEQLLNAVVGETVAERNKRAQEELYKQADREIAQYEEAIRSNHPDVDAAEAYYFNVMAASMKIQNPKIDNIALVERVKTRMRQRASELWHEGHENPIEAMYNEARSLGYSQAQPETKEDAKEIKPDLSKVAANRARNAGTAAAQGQNERGELTPRVAATMTNKEFAKLKPEEKKRLFAALG